MKETWQDKAYARPDYFVRWYNEEATQDLLTHIDETIAQWETIITSYTAITESEIPNVNRSLGSIQALKILRQYLNDLYRELTEEDDESSPE